VIVLGGNGEGEDTIVRLKVLVIGAAVIVDTDEAVSVAAGMLAPENQDLSCRTALNR
jgi:stage V sporulation protein SpoVS